MKKIKLHYAAIILGLLFLISPAQAQEKVFTIPTPLTALDNESGNIAVTNNFQSVFPASTSITGRTACTIQNTGTNPMYVYFGKTQTSVLAEATITNSVKIIAGQPVTCDSNNTVIKTPVWITGNATETYYASQQ